MYYNLYKSIYRNLIVGLDTKIPITNGNAVTAINFDNAATTPPLVSVLKEIVNYAPWYSSIHRGSGYKSIVSSKIYEDSRKIVLDFVGGDILKDTVIYVKNTTEAINKLSNTLYGDDKCNLILSSNMEHHSNDLPWRNKYNVDYISVNKCGKLDLRDLEYKLRKNRGRVKLVTVAGASNVTGYVNPIYSIAALTHRYGAKVLIDGAQLVPHAPIDIKPHNSEDHIDYLVFSAHKMYAPFGTGVLIGPIDTFRDSAPDYVGGGTVEIVNHNYIKWKEPPDKDEAGSPNIMGVVALVSSIRTLKSLGMNNIKNYEDLLTEYTINRLKDLPEVKMYCVSDKFNDRVGIIPFNINGIPHDITAKILSYEWGIAVRNGCFCAQSYVRELLNVSEEEEEYYIKDSSIKRPGMVRISFGMYNDYREIDLMVKAISKIIENKEYYLSKYGGETMA
ncbi:putative cysteine desulfurase [Clostridium pasteurianum DSM 525 = ATCC 6013]|uniref:Cysteine desulfurase n=1 Tax=Clostridium pasteurianum DSM 525 = ATCC 6013 TaxID=1262449 RepID=A0A0H3JB96_CLOPA|nr:aminotransferase class V-fold PLP-dependent enzyme [Clostridium pasteurianum]AJA49345.1 putative cysteine desulfurase [Clostridium pasteurianum DSM 525 = ATCC 6013]AJA53333.1 putative cysteine desulfurase [Clostridium pasteurianum DSM 525 = ATCC 6013]AOZ76519.1 class V aminotransferase [Clostridium pasteurianum DSM 525 = ATCC 6013]AOZ80316.1 class V aminotransferase [Clostridium pasteurianum]ELP58365.1 class V aminotransferase [Clostridium pasteurianum DSM 525 = ATCC 6013]